MMQKHKHLPSQLFEKRWISEQRQGLTETFFSKPHWQYFSQLVYFFLLTPFFPSILGKNRKEKKKKDSDTQDLKN